MPSTFVERNYSKCPLKKRPVHFTFEDSEIKEEPENLCIKKEDSSSSDEIEEKLPQVISSSSSSDIKTSVIVPTPTYPKLNLQPWSYHIPYTTDFYRGIHQPSSNQQVSPLRGDLHSPSSPSEGSLSPPPHFLHGRSSSVSPPIRAEIYRSIDIKHHNTHVIKPEVIPQHRYMPYQMPYHHHHHQPYGFNLAHPPVSPSYSDSSYFSVRSLTPESNGIAPEDLSIKHNIPDYETDDHQDCDIKKFSEKDKVAPPRYQCPDCNKSYSTFSGLTKHQQFHCPAAEGNQVKKSFSCKDCDKTYVSLGALKMHIRTHTLPCKCTICGKAFSRPWLLQGHIRTHTGEKPFSCQHCHRAFADRSNLRAHLQTHSDIKKYSCTTCSKTFSRMSLLTKHSEGGCPGIQVTTTNISTSSSPSYLTSYQEH